MILREVSQGMYGAWRLARLDRHAMRWFDPTVSGVLRSFWAAAIVYPGFLALLALRLDAAELRQPGIVVILIVETIGYVIAWTAYPLLALPLCRWLAPEERALGFIIAYNWAQVLQMAVLLPVTALGATHLAPAEGMAFLDLGVYLGTLAYEWFVARIALAAGGVAATALVLLDIVLGTMLTQVTQSLY